MGCSSSDEVLEYVGLMCSPYGSIEAYRAAKYRDELKKIIKLDTRGCNSFIFSTDETIRNFSQLFSNFGEGNNKDLYLKIFQENDRLVPMLKAKLDQLKEKQTSKIVMIGKADCGKPCYALNPTLFTQCPKCQKTSKEKVENGTYTEQVWDRDKGAYKTVEFYNEENICLNFNFNENVDQCDVNFSKMCEFFDKEDKEKTVHWSGIDNNKNAVEKDMPIHYMMIDGERFEFPYGLHMAEFFYMNDEILFPVPEGWEAKGYLFGIYDEGVRMKMGSSIEYYGIKCLHVVKYFECTSCKLQYHVIKTSPLMYRDKSKDPK